MLRIEQIEVAITASRCGQEQNTDLVLYCRTSMP
jgi:hypothetical protein